MKIKNTILFKIALILIITVVVTLGLFSYINYQLEKKRLMELNDRRAKNRLERLSFILREPFWTYNVTEIKRILSYEFNYDETFAVVVKKENGEFLLGGRDIGDNVVWDSDQKKAAESLTTESFVIRIEKEIQYETSTIGYVDLYYSYEYINNELTSLIIRALLQTFGVSLFLVLAIYFSLKRIIVRPIRELSQMMEEISEENYSSRLETRLKDEIGRLVNSFNRMIERLKSQRQELQQSEIKYHSLFDNAYDAVFLLKDNKIVDCNKRVSAMFEKTKEELIGLSPSEVAEVVRGREKLNHKGVLNRALSGEPQRFEWEFFNKQDELRYCLVSLQKVVLGEEVYIQAIIRDITDKKVSEIRISESEERYRSLVENAPEAIFSLDYKEAIFTSLNPAFEKISGWKKEDWIGKSFIPLIHPEDLPVAVSSLQRIKSGETPVSFELRLLNKNGKFSTIEVTATPQREAGVITGVLGIVRDIELRKQLENELKNSRDFLESVINNVGEPIFVKDEEHRWIVLNDAFCRLVGKEKQELIGKTDYDFFPKEQAEVFWKYDDIVFCNEVPSENEECLTGLDGKTHIISTKKTPYRTADGKKLMTAAIRDITESKEAEEKIRTSLREKEILLKEIHHRVKNNLQIISSLLSLQAGHIKDKHALEIFKNSQNRVKSMALIHERLYKSDNLAQINFAEYVKSLTFSLFRSYQMSGNSINLRLDIDSSIYLGVDTAIPCGLIINELVTNALKYAFPDYVTGEIYISLSLCEDSNYHLVIGNDGVAFPKNVQLENPQTLGLQLVNILANQLKGTLELNSGGITEFIIIFPSRKI